MTGSAKSVASLGLRSTQLGLSICSKCCSPTVTQVRWSRYAPSYMEATCNLKELSEPLDESDLRKYRPIKAATNEMSSSPTYDPLVEKFTSKLMRKGQRELAKNIIINTFAKIKLIQIEKYHKATDPDVKEQIVLDPLRIFHEAIESCKPLLILQQVKRGGVIYKVPIPVQPNYQLYKAMTWLVDSAKEKKESERIWDKLATELLDAARGEGRSVRKKQELHKICEANRAYAHYRW